MPLNPIVAALSVMGFTLLVSFIIIGIVSKACDKLS